MQQCSGGWPGCSTLGWIWQNEHKFPATVHKCRDLDTATGGPQAGGVEKHRVNHKPGVMLISAGDGTAHVALNFICNPVVAKWVCCLKRLQVNHKPVRCPVELGIGAFGSKSIAAATKCCLLKLGTSLTSPRQQHSPGQFHQIPRISTLRYFRLFRIGCCSFLFHLRDLATVLVDFQPGESMSVGYIDTSAELQEEEEEPTIWVTWLQPARYSKQSLQNQSSKAAELRLSVAAFFPPVPSPDPKHTRLRLRAAQPRRTTCEQAENLTAGWSEIIPDYYRLRRSASTLTCLRRLWPGMW